VIKELHLYLFLQIYEIKIGRYHVMITGLFYCSILVYFHFKSRCYL